MSRTVQFKENDVVEIKLIDYIFALLLLFESGSIFFFYKLKPAVAYILFFLLSFLFFKIKKAKIQKDISFMYVVIFVFSCIINKVFIYPDSDNMWLGYIFSCLGPLFFFSAFRLSVFRKAYFRMTAIICIPSIIIYFMDLNNMINDLTIVQAENSNFRLAYGIFVTGWDNISFERMAGIWHEPGACQIFLNTALLLNLPLIRENKLCRLDKFYLIIIIIGILCTQSTGGYIVFAMILFFSQKNIVKSKRRILVFCILLIGAYLVMNSSVVVEKLGQDERGDNSKGTRMRDNIACLYMALDRPLTGYGINSYEFNTKSKILKNATSSNGLLFVSAQLGIWWFFVWLIVTYQACKRQNLGINPLIVLLIIIMIQSNETYIQYPVSFIFLLTFRKENFEGGLINVTKHINT